MGDTDTKTGTADASPALASTLRPQGSPHVASVSSGDCVGRYTVRELLGSGGMGQVYAADDPELGRTVALKVIHTDRASPQARMRLVREAQTLARLRHPNVVAVHDIGSGEPVFIAMELIEGPTIEQYVRSERPSWREAVRVFAEAGRGLAAAHAAGVVHRDFKPSNAIVSDRVVVVDFGLARVADDEAVTDDPARPEALSVALTETGAVMGTVAYMAPEQTDGGTVTEAADQYAFCVSLWEALYGARPDATRTRPPHTRIPARIHAIVERGLAHAPAARWPDMRSLVAALDKAVTRRARVTGVLAAALVAVALASVIGYRVLTKHADKRVAAEQLTRQAEQIRSTMRAAHLLPVHDTKADRDRLHAQMRDVEAQMAELGDVATGPGEFALGAAWLSLPPTEGSFIEAHKHLQAAWDAGERSPELAFELGIVLAGLYEARARQMPPTEGAERNAYVTQARTTLRDPAIAHLRESKGGVTTTPEYVEALIANIEMRFDDAIAHSEAAMRTQPTLYEAGLLEAAVLSRKSGVAAQRGDGAAAQAAQDKMFATFDKIVDIGRSDEMVYRVFADSLAALASSSQDPKDAAAKLARVEELTVKGQQVDSDVTWPDTQHARTLPLMAQNDVALHNDPLAHLRAGIAAAERAIKRDPGKLVNHLALGDAYAAMVDLWESKHGVDVRPSLEKSIAGYKGALAVAPDSDALQGLALSYASLARFELKHGRDPSTAIDAAVKAGDDGFASSPEEALTAHPGSCQLLADYARSLLDHDRGRDAAAVLARAKPPCEAARTENPGEAMNRRAVAAYDSVTALAPAAARTDPAAAWQRAETELAQAIKIIPANAGPHAELAIVRAERAAFELAHKRPPQLAPALAEARKARELDPDGPTAIALARVAIVAARAGDASLLADGAAAATTALAVDAEDTDALLAAAELALLQQRVADGTVYADRVLALDTSAPRALALRAALAAAAK